MNATLPAPQKQATENSPIPASPNTQLLPELANRYTPLKELGSGTQGKVFLAERLADNKSVAIKQLRIDSIKTWKEYTLFHREADVLATLNIPGVVKLYEACDYLEATPPCSYLVQEYIEGMTLKQVLSSGYRFSLDRAYDLILQLIDILEKLHTHQPPVIHRDIKPSNIILQDLDSSHFRVFLIDFGAVANPKVQSGGSTVAGTFGYMSPEQIIGRATPQSDTYALAALFAYIISGVDPADMKTQDLRLIIDPYVENHPVALVQTLRRMLEPDLENRLADLKELRKRFSNFKQGNYILENENYQRFSKQELIDRLNAVKHLCQPQNLEIWQNLPDLPQNREPFPCQIYTHPRFENYPVHQTDPIAPLVSISSLLLGILLVQTPIFLLFIGLLYLNSIRPTADYITTCYFLSLYAALIIGLMTPLIEYIDRRLKLNKVETKGRLPWIKDINYKKSSICNLQEEIYMSGRKTIATINSIEYLAIKRTYDYIKRSDGFLIGKTVPVRIEEPPSFRIYYQFNPPDDNEIDDIVHYVDIHRDPTGLFRAGDPLPILYSGLKVPGKPMRVTQSMPYPFPLDDLENPTDYIGKSMTRHKF